MKKASELVKYVESKIGCGYWYGATGQIGTQTFLDRLTAQSWTAKYHTERLNVICKKSFGKQVFDCVGLIKSFEFDVDAKTGKGVYNAARDVSANGMRLNHCKTRGVIGTIPEIPGILVFKVGHVGVYVGNGYVVEAKSTSIGVVKTKLKDTKWLYWGQCNWFDYTEESAAASDTNAVVPVITPDVINTTSIKIGDMVAIKKTAVRYANPDKTVIPNKIKGKGYTAQCYYGGNKDVIVLKEICSPVAVNDLELYVAPIVVKEITIGDKVKVKTSAACYANSNRDTIPSWVKNKTYIVGSYYGSRKDVVVLKEINSPVALIDLEHA